MAEWVGHVAWWLRPLAALIGSYVIAQSGGAAGAPQVRISG
jgi:hypothetical protein